MFPEPADILRSMIEQVRCDDDMSWMEDLATQEKFNFMWGKVGEKIWSCYTGLKRCSSIEVTNMFFDKMLTDIFRYAISELSIAADCELPEGSPEE